MMSVYPLIKPDYVKLVLTEIDQGPNSWMMAMRLEALDSIMERLSPGR